MENNEKETTKKSKEIIDKPINEEASAKRQRLRQRKTKRDLLYDLDLSAQVPVRKVCFGTIGYQCKAVNRFLTWNSDEAENMMTIEEVLNMNDESSKYLHTPKLIVDDVEVMKALGLTELYNTLFEVEELNDFYSNSISVVSSKLSNMPKDLRDEVLTRTVNMISTGSLVCKNMLGLIKLLKNEYKIEIEI